MTSLVTEHRMDWKVKGQEALSTVVKHYKDAYTMVLVLKKQDKAISR